MPVRKTESRLPPTFPAAQLGQSVTAAGNKVTLVSFLSSPIALRRTQAYVVFVTDAALAATVDSYAWTFNNGGSPTTLNTEIGLAEFTPQNTGSLVVAVKVKGTGGTQLAAVNLTQKVLPLNDKLEVLIDQTESNAPTAADPETSRELVNDLRGYVDLMLSGPGDPLTNKALSSLAYARCLETIAFRRQVFLEALAAILNKGNHKDFLAAAKDGFGVCRTRPQLAAMFLPKTSGGSPYLSLAELPDDKKKQAAAIKDLAKDFNALTEENKIDLFNILRFPKSHLTAAKKILDGLLAKYFSGKSYADVLKEKDPARTLLTQFELGPLAGKVKESTASKRINEMMGNPLWTVKAASLGAASGSAASVPGPVGAPETAPDLTFVAAVTPKDNGYLVQANVYHQSFGLAPQSITSFEKLVQVLSTSSTPIKRLRIVSHFYLDATKVGSAVVIPFFENAKTSLGKQIFYSDRWHFDYGTSDDAGLLGFFVNDILPAKTVGVFSDDTIPYDPAKPSKEKPLHQVLFQVLNKRSDPALTPFGIKSSGPGGAVLTLFRLAGDLFAMANRKLSLEGKNPAIPAIPLPAALLTAWKAEWQARIDKLKTASAPMTTANVNALTAAITGLSMTDLPVQFVGGSLGDFTQGIGGVFVQDHTSFRANLSIVRNRLKNGAVDVRGCQVGGDVAYLKALRTFFGKPGQEPTVSGPDFFQSFSVSPNAIVASESQIDSVFKDGITVSGKPAITGADVQRAYSDWSGMIGFNAQLGFWAELFAGDALTFLAHKWTATLPAIGMEAARLKGLAALSYPNLIPRLREIFFIPAATGPTAAELTSFDSSSMAQVTALKTASDDVDQLTPTSTQAQLTTALTPIKAVATATGQTLPTAPSPLTLDYLKASVAQLAQFLVTASKIQPLFDALKAKAAEPNFGIRTMMAVGLPLNLQQATREDEVVVMYLEARRADALKSLMGIHWASPLPAAVSGAITAVSPSGASQTDDKGTPQNDTARASQMSMLSDEKNKNVTVDPENEFRAHIITEPPSP
jgi:hypothetical protein